MVPLVKILARRQTNDKPFYKRKFWYIMMHCWVARAGCMSWEHFPWYLPFVRVIHRAPIDPPHKGLIMRGFLLSLLSALTHYWTASQLASVFPRHELHVTSLQCAGTPLRHWWTLCLTPIWDSMRRTQLCDKSGVWLFLILISHLYGLWTTT